MIDLRLTEDTIQTLPRPVRAQLESYLYRDNRTREFILCGDDARFFNHSRCPNVVDDQNDPYVCVAAKDIVSGEELTHDYFSFDLLAAKKLGRRSRAP